jgi:shikimate kinase
LLQVSDKNIVLTGFMAVGKSVVGQQLAVKLKRPFVDLDRAIEAREGAKVEDIFKDKGEPYFRKVEKALLREILDQDGQVIATGGGAVMDAENLGLLKERGLLICLTASVETVLRRLGPDRQRPLLRGGHKPARVKKLLMEREEVYARAHIKIDTDRLSVPKVVERILKVLKSAL